MKNIIIPLVLSGGMGSRLWPVSRASYPKHLLSLNKKYTMFQETIIRLTKFSKFNPPTILCNELHKHIVIEQIKETKIKNYFIIVEPIIKNTAPAITAAILKLSKHCNYNTICLVMPTDHSITNLSKFKKIINISVEFAKVGYITSLGISPTYPEEGYGYIKKNNLIEINKLFKKKYILSDFIKKFIEKPNLATAKKLFSSNKYYWNSGIYIFNIKSILKEMNYYIPNIVKICQCAINSKTKNSNILHLNNKAFSKCPNISFDHAIMEKTSNGIVIPTNIKWKDMGTWNSIFLSRKKNKMGNAIYGNVITQNVKNSYIYSENKLIVTIGLNKIIIIDTQDALLVTPLNKTQKIKKITNKLILSDKKEILSNSIKSHTWGKHEKKFYSDSIVINLFTIKPNKYVLIHNYLNTKGIWTIINGNAFIKLKTSDYNFKKKKSISVKNNSYLGIKNISKNLSNLKIIQITYKK